MEDWAIAFLIIVWLISLAAFWYMGRMEGIHKERKRLYKDLDD